jgi:hypothetical protein
MEMAVEPNKGAKAPYYIVYSSTQRYTKLNSAFEKLKYCESKMCYLYMIPVVNSLREKW